MTQNNRQIGAKYEELAAEYLEKKGYRILEKNYRCHHGEIDLIAKGEEGAIVFVEIKYRKTGSHGDPLEAVDYRKQKRISQTALYYYTYHGYSENVPCRFDVIAVYGDYEIKHVENAFEFC